MTRDELIEDNLRLVHSCARRFIGRGIDYDDLYAAGCLGLVKAAGRYDPDLGCALSTYAVPVILGEIRLLFREGGSVRLSRSLQELSVKAKRISDTYREQTGRDMKISELAERLGTDEYKAQEALNASQTVLSLSFGEEDGAPLEIPVESREAALTDRLSLIQAMERLSDDERELIRLRYFCHKTQAKTAEALGITQVQVSRREKKILLKLRGMLSDNG